MSPEPLSLFDYSPDFVVPEVEKEATLSERYAAYVTANPWLLPALARLAREEVELGARRLSMKYLIEILRYHHRRAVERGAEVFWINNSFTSRLARDLMAKHPDLDGLFETRELRSE